jgi:hypothetical protein
MRRKAWLAVSVLALGGSGMRFALQGEFAAIARATLGRAAAPWTGRGFEPAGEIRIGTLNAGERDSLTIPLDSGVQYTALGMCDEDCGDLDLHLHVPDGQEVASDIRSNARPIVQVGAKVAGAYRLEVVMLSCSTPPCYYGIQLLRKRSTP